MKVRTDEMFNKWLMNSMSSESFWAFDLVPYKCFRSPAIASDAFDFSAGDLSLKEKVSSS